jgi:DNA-binding IscR family transcriptional regulator
MSKVSPQTETKVMEQIIGYLYDNYSFPEDCTIRQIAIAIGRNNHFVERLLKKIHEKKLVSFEKGEKNSKVWKLVPAVYLAYRKKVG